LLQPTLRLVMDGDSTTFASVAWLFFTTMKYDEISRWQPIASIFTITLHTSSNLRDDRDLAALVRGLRDGPGQFAPQAISPHQQVHYKYQIRPIP
jgi:hypothetical protein